MDQVKSAVRTLDILELLAGRPEGLLLIQISKELRIPLSSIHALLNTLESRRYIYRDEGNMKYYIGWKLVGLTSQFTDTKDIIRVATPYIEEIRKFCEETITMSVLDGRDILFIYVNTGETKDLQVVNMVGKRLPAYATGSGRAMLSYLSKEKINKIYPEDEFPRLTHKTRVTKAALFASLKEYQEKGYLCDDEESEEGIWAVCSSIHNSLKTQIAGLSIVAPLVRATESRRMDWITLILKAVEKINRKLG